MNCTICVGKTKGLISVAKTKALISLQLIWVFVFAYEDCWFSHDAAEFNITIIYLFVFSPLVRQIISISTFSFKHYW